MEGRDESRHNWLKSQPREVIPSVVPVVVEVQVLWEC